MDPRSGSERNHDQRLGDTAVEAAPSLAWFDGLDQPLDESHLDEDTEVAPPPAFGEAATAGGRSARPLPGFVDLTDDTVIEPEPWFVREARTLEPVPERVRSGRRARPRTITMTRPYVGPAESSEPERVLDDEPEWEDLDTLLDDWKT